MKTLELTAAVPDEHREWLIAELADLDFHSFDEGDDGRLRAYGPAERWNDTRREHVERWLHARGIAAPLEERVYEPENWNARYEATIEPIEVGRFVVKPSWHDVPDDGRIVLEVDPKMSFGTGYHESTRLVLRLLPDLVAGGERVLDAGTGTGILGLAALKLGAREALGFDIDPWASVNAAENAERNGLADRFEVREGGLEVVAETGFDLVLANIHREVLVGLLGPLAEKRAPGAPVVLAGLLEGDEPHIERAAAAAGLRLARQMHENRWWACVLEDAR